MPDASFAVLDDRGILAVSGPDRRSFLQGLVSNDVEKVGPTQARYAALLTAQGKYLHDFHDDRVRRGALARGGSARASAT